MSIASRITGCILGTAVGDALGLPYEGISARRAPRLLGKPDRFRFLFRKGMISDDTEHTCLVAQSLIATGQDSDAFAADLARRFRRWFVSLPAGLGRATLRSCVKLSFGVSPQRSGVFSAGNGPAMRSAILGVACKDIDQMVELVRVSARMTHTDPKAEFGAIAVALAARYSSAVGDTNNEGTSGSRSEGRAYLAELASIIGSDGDELLVLLRTVLDSVAAGQSTVDYAASNGMERGVSGYTYHTVPVAIHAWLSHPHDFRSAVTSCIECGGDADTTAAIVGGIVAARTGEAGIPAEWISNLRDWPRSVNWMRQLSQQLSESIETDTRPRPIEVNFIATLVRNLVFLVTVLLHGIRRLLPPF